MIFQLSKIFETIAAFHPKAFGRLSDQALLSKTFGTLGTLTRWFWRFFMDSLLPTVKTLPEPREINEIRSKPFRKLSPPHPSQSLLHYTLVYYPISSSIEDAHCLFPSTVLPLLWRQFTSGRILHWQIFSVVGATVLVSMLVILALLQPSS